MVGSATKTSAFTVNALPGITSVVPASRAQGVTANVVINGSGYAAGASVSFGVGVTVTSVTRTAGKLTAHVVVDPAALVGTRDVTVTNADGGTVTCFGCFTVNAAPTVATISPDSRAAGARAAVDHGDGLGVPDGRDGPDPGGRRDGQLDHAQRPEHPDARYHRRERGRCRSAERDGHEPRWRGGHVWQLLHGQREADRHVALAGLSAEGNHRCDRDRHRDRVPPGCHGDVLAHRSDR